MAGVTPFKNLGCLSMNGNKVTDADLRHLEGLAKLEVLDVKGTQITDGCFKYLRKLRNLKMLSAGGTELSTAASEAFEKDVPECKVLRND